MIERRPLNVIWRRRTLDLVPESYFIERVLLGELGRPVRVIAVERFSETPFLNDVLVVSMMTEYAPFLAEARRRGMRNLMLFHLGDEQGTDDRTIYADVDLVLRNYWFETIMDKGKVEWVPNGYAIGVGPAAPNTRLRASQRSRPGFFAGALDMRALSHERQAMKVAVEEADVGFEFHFTATWRDRLGPAAYAAHLADARFALVPGGNSPETIRLYDALEMGAVPIMLRSAFVDAPDALNGPPFLLLDDWTQFAAAYSPFADGSPRSLAALDALQDEVVTWWQRYKRAQQEKLRRLIDGVMDH
jgi:hypothetical protein